MSKNEIVENNNLPVSGQLQEGVHFNFENGFLVFTSYYLTLRGFCCKNGCKNCPYNYNKKDP